MANFSFAKYSRREKLKFFQSSLPYLQNNALILHSTGKTKRWFLEEPHPTNLSFLTFKNGHYGIYFTLFNHELRKKDHDTSDFSSKKIFLILSQKPSQRSLPEFFISKAKQDTHNEINWIKTVTRNFLSTASFIRLKYARNNLRQTRSFSTCAFRAKEKPLEHSAQAKAGNPNLDIEDTAQKEEKSPGYDPSMGEDELIFEDSFLNNQVIQIVDTFNNHSSNDDLNIIYPLYQSLKRNKIYLPSIKEYNIILKSITNRSLDSEFSLLATESRLTTLLTVYLDVIAACQLNDQCHPNTETYQIVLGAIFDGSKKVLDLATTSSLPRHALQQAKSKCLEFCQVGVKLFTSLSTDVKSAIIEVLPNILYCLKTYPYLINKSLASLLVDFKNYKLHDAQFYVYFLLLIKFIRQPNFLNLGQKESYSLISAVFINYKAQCQGLPQLASHEYDVYSALIQALIESENHHLATKFLDQVIMSYKEGSMVLKSITHDVQALSGLISDYLKAIMNLGTDAHLERAYNLLKVIRETAYLPDTDATVYNEMICKFISVYTEQEQQKAHASGADDLNRLQESTYRKIWDLFNYVSIRRDFLSCQSVNATQKLLSLAIDLEDRPKVSRLIKEVLLKRIYLGDWNVTRKLCHFLLQEFFVGESYHYRVMWSIIEQQVSLLQDDPKQLNDFLSELIPYLLLETPETFSLVINLEFVRSAFEKFNLQTDNLYGLSCVVYYLQKSTSGRHMSDVDQAKVLDLLGCLVNQFEDPENHYLELPSDVLSFKESTKSFFMKMYLAAESNSLVTCNVCQAGSALSLPQREARKDSLSLMHYQKDLIPYMNLGSQDGIKIFIDHLKKGCNFNYETWNAIISRNFVLVYLESGNVFLLRMLLERVCLIGNNDEVVSLLKSLILLRNDKVNIETFKFLATHKFEQLLVTPEILDTLSKFAGETKNQYFLTLWSSRLNEICKFAPKKSWMTPVLKNFNDLGRYGEVYSIINKNFEEFNRGLDISNTEDELYLATVLTSFIKVGKRDDINKLFNYHFPGSNEKKILASSLHLLPRLLEYYISVGSYDLVLRDFATFASRSSQVNRALQFAALLLSIKGLEVTQVNLLDGDAQSLAIKILMEHNFLNMKAVYDSHKHMIGNNEAFFNTMIDTLAKVSKSLDRAYSHTVVAKFEGVIKLCKTIGLQRISARTLENLIDFMAISELRNLLNILFAKFLINDNLTYSFNFYFLRVELHSSAELKKIMEKFEIAFRKIGDSLNLGVIREFNNLQCPTDLQSHLAMDATH